MIEQITRRMRLVLKTVLRRELDGLDQLQMDHMKVEMLFAQVKATRARSRREAIYKKIRKDLVSHTHAEETVFYPMLEKNESLKNLVLEAYEEHKQVKTLLREIDALASDSQKFDAKLTLLIENVMHHVREEENKLFPKVRRRFDRDELVELASSLRAAKRDEAAAA